ncbi:hypothetical protein POM88_035833 [Heracleum sosnowskyi]|uniref:CCHC-type domain-containing protein n=1 Tax=Heracleum sosnowskyi TaxID=360622 RepID=A0AAD8HM98_9APIA|nr:hypothetical protein POM88_035833 [Heracleum sosnowskyi]
MYLLQQNLNQHLPPPPGPNSAGQNAFKAFKSLRPPEFQGSADPIEARAWLKEMEKSFEILGSQGGRSVNRSFPVKPFGGTRSQPLRSSEFRRTENKSLSQGGRQIGVSHFSQPRPPLPDCKTCGRKHLGECTLKLVICLKCNKTGHYSKTCPQNNQKCYQCGKLGHLKRDCPMENPTDSRISGAASNKP